MSEEVDFTPLTKNRGMYPRNSRDVDVIMQVVRQEYWDDFARDAEHYVAYMVKESILTEGEARQTVEENRPYFAEQFELMAKPMRAWLERGCTSLH